MTYKQSIRDYGTHVITNAVLGARIEVQHWFRKSKQEEAEEQLTSWKASAQVSAKKYLSVGGGYGTSEKTAVNQGFSASVQNMKIKE